MDDFERGAREMQLIAATLLDALVTHTEAELRTVSKGLDHAYTFNRLQEKRNHYIEAAAVVRSIQIKREVAASG